MKIINLIMFLFFATSCATFRSDKEWAKINEQNAKTVYENIKSGDLKTALESLRAGVDFEGHDYYKYDLLYIHDADGYLRTLYMGNSVEVMLNRRVENLKLAVVLLSEFYKCSIVSSDNVKDCLERLTNKHSSRTVDGTNLYPSEDNDKTQVPRLIAYMCGKKYSSKPDINFISVYAFNSIYSNYWVELKKLRESNFCR